MTPDLKTPEEYVGEFGKSPLSDLHLQRLQRIEQLEQCQQDAIEACAKIAEYHPGRSGHAEAIRQFAEKLRK